MRTNRLRLVILGVFALVATVLLLRNRESESAVMQAPASHGLNLARALVAQHTEIGAPERTAGGKVIAAEGQMIAGARVCATCASCEVTSTNAQICTNSGPDGVYVLRGLGAVGYRLSASAKGFASGLADGGAPVFLEPGATRSDLDIHLGGPGVPLVGQVLDAAGGPIADANVRVVSWGALATACDLHTDEDGKFEAWSAPGRTTLIASAEGYATARLARVAPSRGIQLVLTPAGSVEGTVVRDIDGSPVANAKVQAQGAHMSPVSGLRVTTSAADGRFVLSELEPSQHTISASAPGYLGRAESSVTVGLGETISGVRIVLSAVAQVSGRVLTASTGAACTEGSVILGPPSPELGARPGAKHTFDSAAGIRSPTTLFSPIGAQGAVHFDAVPPGQYFATVQCQGHTLRDGPEVLTVGATNIEGLTWKVAPGLSLALRVVDEAERPVPAAEVFLDWPPRAEGATLRMPLVMDGKGQHTMAASLFPGVYTLRANGGYQAEPVSAVLKEGAGTVEAVLRLKGSGAIDVQVEDSQAAGIDGLMLRAQPVDTSTDAPAPPAAPALFTGHTASRGFGAVARGEGHYRIGPLQPGSYRVEIDDGVNATTDAAQSSQRLIQVVAGGTAAVTMTLKRDARIVGRVVDSAGAPIVNAWVSASQPTAANAAPGRRGPRAPWDRRGRVLSDTTGHFAIENLVAEAEYQVRAEEPERAAVQRTVRSGTEVELVMPKTGSIRGIVTDDVGKPLDAFAVQVLEPESGNVRTRDFTGAKGEFLIAGLAPGSLQVTALERSGRVAESRVELSSGQVLDGVVLRLPGPEAPTTARRDVSLPAR